VEDRRGKRDLEQAKETGGQQARHVARLLQEKRREGGRETESLLETTPYQNSDMGGVRGGVSFGSTGDEATGLRVHCIHVV